jgi:hypothetical protein
LPAPAFDLLFCRIPALLASLYLGATCEGTTMALHSGRLLSVTPACGGSDFFILVCSMITWYAMRPQNARNSTGNIKATQTSNIEHPTFNIQRPILNKATRQSRSLERSGNHSANAESVSGNKAILKTIRDAGFLLFMAWAFVNGVNSMRVVLSVWTRLASEVLLPERFDAAVHMVSGVMIFFPSLLCVWWLCNMRTYEVFSERKN